MKPKQGTGISPLRRRPDINEAKQHTYEGKEELLRESGFSPLPPAEARELPLGGKIYNKITPTTVQRAIFRQSTRKVPGLDLMGFRAIHFLWEWDSKQVVNTTRACIRLSHHPQAWQSAKGIVLRKADELDYSIPKVYRIISLLNCLGKVFERVAADLLSQTMDPKLHAGQFGCRKNRSVVDVAACMTNHV